MRLGILCSIVRTEEKLIFEAFRGLGVEFDRIDDRGLILDLNNGNHPWDIVLERAVNHSRALHTLKILNDRGITTVNSWI